MDKIPIRDHRTYKGGPQSENVKKERKKQRQ